MTLSERLQYCRVCQNRSFNPSMGLVCNLTSAKPTFEGKCESYVLDQAEAQKELSRQKAREISAREDVSGFFAPERKGMQKGVLGGVIMLVIAGIWFFGGLAAGIIFYYPPILAVIGIVAIVKGAATGNLAGEKNK